MALDRCALRRDHHGRLAGVGDRVVDLDCAGSGDREDRDDRVDLLGQQRRDAAGRGDCHEFDRNAKRLAHLGGDLDVEAGRLQVRSQKSVGRRGRIDSHDQFAASDYLLDRLRGCQR